MALIKLVGDVGAAVMLLLGTPLGLHQVELLGLPRKFVLITSIRLESSQLHHTITQGVCALQTWTALTEQQRSIDKVLHQLRLRFHVLEHLVVLCRL